MSCWPKKNITHLDQGVQLWKYFIGDEYEDGLSDSYVYIDYEKQEITHFFVKKDKNGDVLYPECKLEAMKDFTLADEWFQCNDDLQYYSYHRYCYIQYLTKRGLYDDFYHNHVNEPGYTTIKEEMKIIASKARFETEICSNED